MKKHNKDAILDQEAKMHENADRSSIIVEKMINNRYLDPSQALSSSEKLKHKELLDKMLDCIRHPNVSSFQTLFDITSNLPGWTRDLGELGNITNYLVIEHGNRVKRCEAGTNAKLNKEKEILRDIFHSLSGTKIDLNKKSPIGKTNLEIAIDNNDHEMIQRLILYSKLACLLDNEINWNKAIQENVNNSALNILRYTENVDRQEMSEEAQLTFKFKRADELMKTLILTCFLKDISAKVNNKEHIDLDDTQYNMNMFRMISAYIEYRAVTMFIEAKKKTQSVNNISNLTEEDKKTIHDLAYETLQTVFREACSDIMDGTLYEPTHGLFDIIVNILKMKLLNRESIDILFEILNRRKLHITINVSRMFETLLVIDFETPNSFGETSLMHALKKGDKQRALLLIKEDVKRKEVNSKLGNTQTALQYTYDYNSFGVNGNSILHYAVHFDQTPGLQDDSETKNKNNKKNKNSSGEINIIQELLNDKSINLNATNIDGLTPLMLAIEVDNDNAALLLLDYTDTVTLTTLTNQDNETVIDIAKRKKNIKLVSFIEETINHPQKRLSQAILDNNSERLERYLNMNLSWVACFADQLALPLAKTQKTDFYQLAFATIVKQMSTGNHQNELKQLVSTKQFLANEAHRFDELLNILLNKKYSQATQNLLTVTPDDWQDAFLMAFIEFERFYQQNPGQKIKTGKYSNILKMAIKNNDFEIVKLLIEAGADVNQVDQLGINAIGCAARNPDSRYLELLLNHSKKVDKNYGMNGKIKNMIYTPIYHAVVSKNLTNLIMLFEYGFQLTIKDHEDVLMTACIKNKNYPALIFFLKNAIKIFTKSDLTETLQIAIENDQYDLFHELIKCNKLSPDNIFTFLSKKLETIAANQSSISKFIQSLYASETYRARSNLWVKLYYQSIKYKDADSIQLLEAGYYPKTNTNSNKNAQRVDSNILDLTDDHGESAIFKAFSAGDKSSIISLLDKAAELKVNSTLQSPFQIALNNKHLWVMLSIVQDYSVILKKQDSESHTFLHVLSQFLKTEDIEKIFPIIFKDKFENPIYQDALLIKNKDGKDVMSLLAEKCEKVHKLLLEKCHLQKRYQATQVLEEKVEVAEQNEPLKNEPMQISKIKPSKSKSHISRKIIDEWKEILEKAQPDQYGCYHIPLASWRKYVREDEQKFHPKFPILQSIYDCALVRCKAQVLTHKEETGIFTSSTLAPYIALLAYGSKAVECALNDLVDAKSSDVDLMAVGIDENSFICALEEYRRSLSLDYQHAYDRFVQNSEKLNNINKLIRESGINSSFSMLFDSKIRVLKINDLDKINQINSDEIKNVLINVLNNVKTIKIPMLSDFYNKDKLILVDNELNNILQITVSNEKSLRDLLVRDNRQNQSLLVDKSDKEHVEKVFNSINSFKTIMVIIKRDITNLIEYNDISSALTKQIAADHAICQAQAENIQSHPDYIYIHNKNDNKNKNEEKGNNNNNKDKNVSLRISFNQNESQTPIQEIDLLLDKNFNGDALKYRGDMPISNILINYKHQTIIGNKNSFIDLCNQKISCNHPPYLAPKDVFNNNFTCKLRCLRYIYKLKDSPFELDQLTESELTSCETSFAHTKTGQNIFGHFTLFNQMDKLLDLCGSEIAYGLLNDYNLLQQIILPKDRIAAITEVYFSNEPIVQKDAKLNIIFTKLKECQYSKEQWISNPEVDKAIMMFLTLKPKKKDTAGAKAIKQLQQRLFNFLLLTGVDAAKYLSGANRVASNKNDNQLACETTRKSGQNYRM